MDCWQVDVFVYLYEIKFVCIIVDVVFNKGEMFVLINEFCSCVVGNGNCIFIVIGMFVMIVFVGFNIDGVFVGFEILVCFYDELMFIKVVYVYEQVNL